MTQRLTEAELGQPNLTRSCSSVSHDPLKVLDRGDAIDLDIERPWMRGYIHEHACGRILRKEFRIDAVDGGEHLRRCAIDSIGALTISPVAGSNGGRPDT